jgi:hypothetical protein
MLRVISARDVEQALLARCVAVARDAAQDALDQKEANVFLLAASVIRSRCPAEAARLSQASAQYFAAHPEEQLFPAEVVRRGWVVTLPRFRDLLLRRLQQGESGRTQTASRISSPTT